jgi:xanthine dehydrogenase molybdopterin-binding subunit B
MIISILINEEPKDWDVSLNDTLLSVLLREGYFGVKAVAEIPLDGVAPAVGNAIQDACGAVVEVIPATPERVWKALQDRNKS